MLGKSHYCICVSFRLLEALRHQPPLTYIPAEKGERSKKRKGEEKGKRKRGRKKEGKEEEREKLEFDNRIALEGEYFVWNLLTSA